MNWRNLIFRLIVVAALLGAIVRIALHREFLQAAGLERELARFGPWAPILFVVLYAFATVLFAPDRHSLWPAALCSAPCGGEHCGT